MQSLHMLTTTLSFLSTHLHILCCCLSDMSSTTKSLILDDANAPSPLLPTLAVAYLTTKALASAGRLRRLLSGHPGFDCPNLTGTDVHISRMRLGARIAQSYHS